MSKNTKIYTEFFQYDNLLEMMNDSKENKYLEKCIICNKKGKPIKHKNKYIYGVKSFGSVFALTTDLDRLEGLIDLVRKEFLELESTSDEYRSEEEIKEQRSDFPVKNTNNEDLVKYHCVLLEQLLKNNAESVYDFNEDNDMYLIAVKNSKTQKLTFCFVGNVWDFHECNLLDLGLNLEGLNEVLDDLIEVFELPKRKREAGLLTEEGY